MSGIMAFTTPQVIRLTSLSDRMLRYWEATGVYTASHVDPRPGVPFRRIYSFRDVVSLRTLSLLRREHRVPLDELRRVGIHLRGAHPDRVNPWAEMRFGVLNRRVLIRDPATGTWVAPPGQQVLAIDVAEIARCTARDAPQLTARRPETLGRVERHRLVLGNAWRIAGTRIPTSAIQHFHEAGADTAAILREHPDLTGADVDAALRHEAAQRNPRRIA